MKTLIALLTLAVIATATPVLFPSNIETSRQSNRLSSESSSQYREKKSSSPILEETLNDKTEHDSTKEHLFETRNLGLKKPITIKKKFGIRRFRDSEETREANLMDDCKNQVKVPVCNEESQNSSKQLRATDISDQEMENNIKMAKEAVDNLHRELHKIVESSPKSSDTKTSAIDFDLHNNVEIARKALENIQQNFGNLEKNNREKENNLNVKASDEERLAQWREAVNNIQKNFEIAKNIEDAFKSNENEREVFSKVEDLAKSQMSVREVNKNQSDQLKTPDKDTKNIENVESLSDNTKTEMDKTKNLERGRSQDDDKIKSNMQTQEKVEKSDQMHPTKLMEHMAESDKAKKAHVENKDHVLKDLSSHGVSDGSASMNKNDRMLKNESNDPTMKSSDHVDEKFETNPQEKKQPEHGNPKLFDTLSMRLAENSKHKQDMSSQFESGNPKNDHINRNLMPGTPDTNLMPQDQMTLKMVPTKLNEEQNLNMPLSSRMPPTGHVRRQDFGTSDMNFAQNNLNVFQNQDNNMVEVNEHHNLEDPFFSRWATDHQRNDMPFEKSQREHLRPQMHDLHMGDHEDPSTKPNLHNHMHGMHHHHASSDNTMQPSMRMNMRNDLGKSSIELNGMQWQNQPHLRTSYGSNYGSSGASSMSTSSSSGDSGHGAVGIFPNAKVGGCAIPLLVSCSPSLVSGSLAKAHASQSQTQSHSTFANPNYRSGDDLMYYMKRDAKVDEVPVIKFQKTLAPLNRKTELIFEKNHYQ